MLCGFVRHVKSPTCCRLLAKRRLWPTKWWYWPSNCLS